MEDKYGIIVLKPLKESNKSSKLVVRVRISLAVFYFANGKNL